MNRDDPSGVTVSPREWIARGRHGAPVGVCRAAACGGLLYVPTDIRDGQEVRVPFTLHDGRRLFEAVCNACGAGYAEWAGRDDQLGAVIPKSTSERAYASDPARDRPEPL